MAVFGALIEKLYTPILEEAKERNIPVLDMANSLDSYNRDNYFEAIAPGLEGGKTIAKGLAHIIKNHDYSGPSRIYSKPPRIEEPYRSEVNDPSSWRVEYIAPERV